MLDKCKQEINKNSLKQEEKGKIIRNERNKNKFRQKKTDDVKADKYNRNILVLYF